MCRIRGDRRGKEEEGGGGGKRGEGRREKNKEGKTNLSGR